MEHAAPGKPSSYTYSNKKAHIQISILPMHVDPKAAPGKPRELPTVLLAALPTHTAAGRSRQQLERRVQASRAMAMGDGRLCGSQLPFTRSRSHTCMHGGRLKTCDLSNTKCHHGTTHPPPLVSTHQTQSALDSLLLYDTKVSGVRGEKKKSRVHDADMERLLSGRITLDHRAIDTM